MRPIHKARVGTKVRPVLMLTREYARADLNQLTVAAITSRVRGLSTEVPVGRRNGLDTDSVINVDLVYTIPVAEIGAHIGWFYPDQEAALTDALHIAYDLE